MASRIGINLRREKAMDRLRLQVDRLRSRGVDAGPWPDRQRDPEVQALNELQYYGDLLEAAAGQIDALQGRIAELEAAAAGQGLYGSLEMTELKAEITKRDLKAPSGAKKGDLVAILEAADAEGEQEPRSDADADSVDSDAPESESDDDEGGDDPTAGDDQP